MKLVMLLRNYVTAETRDSGKNKGKMKETKDFDEKL